MGRYYADSESLLMYQLSSGASGHEDIEEDS